MNKVFVYGTLRQGKHNHYMMKGSDFIGSATTDKGFTKHIDGLPYLIEDGTGHGCGGELYEVSDLMLKMLDRFEGHPNWYRRKEIKIFLDNGESTMAWCYLMPKENI